MNLERIVNTKQAALFEKSCKILTTTKGYMTTVLTVEKSVINYLFIIGYNRTIWKTEMGDLRT